MFDDFDTQVQSDEYQSEDWYWLSSDNEVPEEHDDWFTFMWSQKD